MRLCNDEIQPLNVKRPEKLRGLRRSHSVCKPFTTARGVDAPDSYDVNEKRRHPPFGGVCLPVVYAFLSGGFYDTRIVTGMCIGLDTNFWRGLLAQQKFFLVPSVTSDLTHEAVLRV
jgi:hypothetical protein